MLEEFLAILYKFTKFVLRVLSSLAFFFFFITLVFSILEYLCD